MSDDHISVHEAAKTWLESISMGREVNEDLVASLEDRMWSVMRQRGLHELNDLRAASDRLVADRKDQKTQLERIRTVCALAMGFDLNTVDRQAEAIAYHGAEGWVNALVARYSGLQENLHECRKTLEQTHKTLKEWVNDEWDGEDGFQAILSSISSALHGKEMA